MGLRKILEWNYDDFQCLLVLVLTAVVIIGIAAGAFAAWRQVLGGCG